jgi:acetyl esterase/lipase
LLPVPAAASPELRAAIAGAGQPNPNSLGVAPATAQEWRELVAAREQDWAVSLKELGDSLGVSISRDTIAGVAVHRVAPAKVAPENTGRLFVYLHGGAYVFRGGDGSVGEGALISAMSGIPAVSIDYRMPPDHPHPAAVLDVLAVYRELLKSHEAAAIGIGGTSAGGGLTLASVHKLKSEGLPLPGALYVGTPWTDLTKTSDSLYTNDSIDRMLVRYDGVLAAAARLYAGDTDLKDPLLSPVYGDFSGFPPTYLVTGTRDMFLSDTARVHRKLRVAGVDADLNVYEGLSHAEYAVVVGSPEWQQVYGELVAFLRKHLAPAKS